MQYLNQSPNQNSTNQSTKEDDADIKAILHYSLRKWPYILISICVCVAIAFLINRWSTPIYRVSSTVIVTDDQPSLGLDLFEASGLLQSKSNLENEIGILKSYALAEQTVSNLNLNVSYFSEGIVKKTQLYGNDKPIEVDVDWTHPQLLGGKLKVTVVGKNQYRINIEEGNFLVFNPDVNNSKESSKQLSLLNDIYNFGEEIEGDFFKFKINNQSGVIGSVIYFYLNSNATVASRYEKAVSIAPINKQASILRISIQTPVIELGKDYLNQLMTSYIDRELKNKNRAAENTIKFIESQLSGITDSLTFFENRLERYRSENRIFNLSEEGSKIFDRLQDMAFRKSETEIALNYYQTLFNYVENDQIGEIIAPSIIGISDPLLNNLVVNLTALQADLLLLSDNYYEQTPAVRDIKSQLENTKKALKENLKSAIENNRILTADLNRRIELVEKEVNMLPETERRLLGIQRQFTINENIYIYLLEKRAEAEITRASNISKHSILDYAKAESGIVSPNHSRNMALGFSLGLTIPILLIFLKVFLNDKIENPKLLEEKLSIPFIGHIGRETAQDALSVLHHPMSSFTESFRSLRSDVNFLAPNKEKITLLFTSAISGEGKTFCAANLAGVYSLIGKKTLLLGLDLRKPKIAQLFNLENTTGISTCLSTDTTWQSVINKTDYENLDVILSGPIPPNPSELLQQKKFTQIMQEIKEAYDIVIMDCPPVGMVSETRELFKYADVNFFLFRQGFSPIANIQMANSLIEKSVVSKLYAILNDVDAQSGYGYAYGYGYSAEEKIPWYKQFKLL
ncbi:polysaccharide biosynthesis tyrosine autokinase [Belliella sp. R4-6]|uniref:non-specific protein-tyrosine kinase n=1 Tax=Belliella alkalica TaxID=1730871 RepID=A0ABS9V7Y9_9BACT|nr:polysaccharide biosynthesis tyrosine autokinase [Belliella alkalica]MCH7412075.1 polysaccharide biosynthesis tyrosine autokinase [Belliella alkalica]